MNMIQSSELQQVAGSMEGIRLPGLLFVKANQICVPQGTSVMNRNVRLVELRGPVAYVGRLRAYVSTVQTN